MGPIPPKLQILWKAFPVKFSKRTIWVPESGSPHWELHFGSALSKIATPVSFKKCCSEKPVSLSQAFNQEDQKRKKGKNFTSSTIHVSCQNSQHKWCWCYASLPRRGRLLWGCWTGGCSCQRIWQVPVEALQSERDNIQGIWSTCNNSSIKSTNNSSQGAINLSNSQLQI